MRIPSGKTDQYICAACRETKDATAFGIDRALPRGRKYSCRECVNAKRRGGYHVENRRYYLKSRYGLTVEEFEDLYDRQGGRCAICNRVPIKRSGGGRARESIGLFVDHDHTTGVVRGLLCHQCNVAIGHFREDPALLRQAILYLDRS